jgi:hypothetical protein
MVNRVLLERILGDIKANVRDMRNAVDITWDVYRTDKRARRFVERTLHIMIEACIDVAQHVISDEGFREPSSYRDAFAVLAEHGILHSPHFHLGGVSMRKTLLVDGGVYHAFTKSIAGFEVFRKWTDYERMRGLLRRSSSTWDYGR